jgi:membrane protein DedA with SNARE-associated domain
MARQRHDDRRGPKRRCCIEIKGLRVFTLDNLLQLIQSHGLWLLVPFAIIEGPIVTVIAAYLAHLGYLNVWAVYAVCLISDLVGDAMYYGIGRLGPRFLPAAWLDRIGLSQARQIALSGHFTAKGGRTLLIGKWTHSTGLPIMLASGLARMNFAVYMWYNLLGSVPKTALFVLLGYFIGAAYASIDTYIARISLVLLAAVVVTGLVLWYRRK